MKGSQCRIVSSSPEETSRIGAVLGRHLTKGLMVALNGDLGSGKTCLTQGIARGLKVPEDFYVTSPSYSIVNEYPGRLRLMHVDLYRVEHPGEFEDLGLDEIMAADGVTVIEWAEKMMGNLPEERLSVSISIVDDQTRALHLIGYGSQATDLVEECRREFENRHTRQKDLHVAENPVLGVY